MNLNKTVAKINALTASVHAEVGRRRNDLAEHGKKTNTLFEEFNKAVTAARTALEKRQANKAIALDKKCKEAEACLDTLRK